MSVNLVRKATEADLDAIVAIYNSTIVSRMATADLIPVTVDERRKWFELHQNADYPLWVSVTGERISGWLSLQPFHERAAYKKVLEISLYIHPEFRKQGLGTLLMQNARQFVARNNLFGIVAMIFKHNTPSIGFFLRHGFKYCGELPDVAEMDGQRYSLSYYILMLN